MHLRRPKDAIKAGVSFVSEDRKAEGIIPALSVRENLTLAALDLLSRFGVVSAAAQRKLVEKFVQRLRIKAASFDQPISQLSGGNQQKVLLARWLCRNPRLLLLDEPTRGIDVGAKAEIQALIEELAAEGMGVLMISSELEELEAAAMRVVVMRHGQVAGELQPPQITAQQIIAVMAHGSEAQGNTGA